MFTKLILVGSVVACVSSWGLWANAQEPHVRPYVDAMCSGRGELNAAQADAWGFDAELAYTLAYADCLADTAEREAAWAETDRPGPIPDCWFGPEGACELVNSNGAQP